MCKKFYKPSTHIIPDDVKRTWYTCLYQKSNWPIKWVKSTIWNLKITEEVVTKQLRQIYDPDSILATGGHISSAVSFKQLMGECWHVYHFSSMRCVSTRNTSGMRKLCILGGNFRKQIPVLHTEWEVPRHYPCSSGSVWHVIA